MKQSKLLKRMMAFLLAICLLAACLPLSAWAAQTDLSAAECMEIAEQYWDGIVGGGNTIYDNYATPKAFNGKKYYYYTLQKFMGTYSTTIDYLFVEVSTGDCYFGVGKPEYQIFKNYEDVLQRLIKEKDTETTSAIWNRGIFFDINGDSHNELLVLREIGNDYKLTGTVFSELPSGKVIPLIQEVHLQNDVAAPYTAIYVLKKDNQKYISLFERNGETTPEERIENGSHKIYALYDNSDSSLSAYDNPTIVTYEKVIRWSSPTAHDDGIDLNASYATIDGKKVTWQAFLTFMENFEVIEYISTPFAEYMSPPSSDFDGYTSPRWRGYTFEELLEQCGSQDTPPDPDDSPSPFSDVFSDDYYKEAVEWAVELGITNGTGNGKFSPNAACTRAQIVTFLWRAAGSPEPTSGLSMFSDVEENEYYGEAVRWAIEQGITNGTGNGKFSPEAACTRGQAVTFLWRAAGEPSAGTAGFSDVYTSDYYAPAVNWAVQNDVTAGTGNNRFSPNWKCTRAQIVTFLYRYAN